MQPDCLKKKAYSTMFKLFALCPCAEKQFAISILENTFGRSMSEFMTQYLLCPIVPFSHSIGDSWGKNRTIWSQITFSCNQRFTLMWVIEETVRAHCILFQSKIKILSAWTIGYFSEISWVFKTVELPRILIFLGITLKVSSNHVINFLLCSSCFHLLQNYANSNKLFLLASFLWLYQNYLAYGTM